MNSDEQYCEFSDVTNGLTFHATLQLRTPLCVLEHHGEIFHGLPSKTPAYGSSADGIWLPKTKTWAELGAKIAVPDAGEGMSASDIGSVLASEYLPYLRAFRHIVEGDSDVQTQCQLIRQLSQKSEAFAEINGKLQRSYPGFPDSWFWLQLTRLPGVGRVLAKRIYDAGLQTPAAVRSASTDDLCAIPGVGKGLITKLQSRY